MFFIYNDLKIYEMILIIVRETQFLFNYCVQLYLPSAVSEPENHSIPNNYYYIL